MPEQESFFVKPLGLNLRSAPDPNANNIIAVLPQGHEVKKIEESPVANWWKVQTTFNGVATEGFVKSNFLSPENEPAAGHEEIDAVHLKSSNGASVTRNGASRAYPLTEIPPARRRAEDPANVKVDAIRQLIDWFKVETSTRYVRTGNDTFCNIYAYDYCYMTGAYIPRVWWTEPSLIKLHAGESVPVKYGVTVLELTANSLNKWFKEWGTKFGWRQVLSLTEMQNEANAGKVCITVAKNNHGHGHIVAVVPENETFKAVRQNGEVIKPLQSEAGATNNDYIARRWWDNFADFGHWVHD